MKKNVGKLSILTLLSSWVGPNKISHLSMLGIVAFIRIQNLKLTGKHKCFHAETDQEMYSCREIQPDRCCNVRLMSQSSGLMYQAWFVLKSGVHASSTCYGSWRRTYNHHIIKSLQSLYSL